MAGAPAEIFSNCCLNAELFEVLALFKMESKNTNTKNAVAVYFVILVSALPDPAPNSASVAPPPKRPHARLLLGQLNQHQQDQHQAVQDQQYCKQHN